jgi:hypothetical protein
MEILEENLYPVKCRKAAILLNNFAFGKIAAKQHLTGLFNRVRKFMIKFISPKVHKF